MYIRKINPFFFSLIVLHKENIHALETSADVFIFVPHQSKSQQREAAVTPMLRSVRQQLIGLLRLPGKPHFSSPAIPLNTSRFHCSS